MTAVANNNACAGGVSFARRNMAWQPVYLSGLFWTCLALTTGVLLYLSFNVLLNGTWDNYRYLNLGRAIYQQGHFVQIDVPGAPPETTVSPGYPFLLSVIMKIAGHTRPILSIKAFNSFCYGVSIILMAWISMRFFGLNRLVGSLFCLYLATNVAMSAFASLVFTHSPYIFFSTLTLLAVLYYGESKKAVWLGGAAACTTLAIYVRLPGLPLAVAVFVWLLCQKRLKHACLYAGAVAALIGLWALPPLFAGDSAYLKQLSTGGSEQSSLIFNSWWHRYWHHLFGYLCEQIPARMLPGLFLGLFPLENTMLPALSTFITSHILKSCLKIILLALFLSEFFGGLLEKKYSLATLFPLVYILMISAAAPYWGRYVNYVIPWIILACILGAKRVINTLDLSYKARMLVACVAVFIVVASILPHYVYRVRESSLHRKQLVLLARQGENGQVANKIVDGLPRFPVPLGALPAETTLVSQTLYGMHSMPVIGAFKWCRENLPPEALLMGCQTALGCFHTERPVQLLPYWWNKHSWDDPRAVLPESNEWIMREVLRLQTTHLVMDLNDSAEPCNQYMVRAVNAFSDCFDPVHISGTLPASAVVLKINRKLLINSLQNRNVEDLPEY